MTFVIAGFGKFGRLAMERLIDSFPEGRVVVVEQDSDQVREIPERITVFMGDASVIIANAHGFRPDDIIIPMVPFNLAAECVLRSHPRAEKTPLPEVAAALLPNPYVLDECNVACSRADFICPDDCPEVDFCTVTGEPRAPLYSELEHISIADCAILVQRSFQILPGIGGYTFESLARLAGKVESGRCLIATSCKCHAILTCLRVAVS